MDRAYLLTYSNQALYDASGTILPIKDAPQRAFLAEFNSHIQPRVVGDETFSTVVLTLDGKVALLQDFPTPEKNGALLVEIHEDVLLHFLEQSLGNFGPIGCSHLLRRQLLSLGDPGGNLYRTCWLELSALAGPVSDQALPS